MDDIVSAGFTFLQNFDSGNLGSVEFLGEHTSTENDESFFEFILWTRPDNAGTVYENGNRTWFYFGVKGGKLNASVKFNIQMNKQSKMYGQGMVPVFRTVPGRSSWERIREKPVFCINRTKSVSPSGQGPTLGKFTLSFKHRLQDNDKVVTYFAFTYPFSYTELQSYLNTLELVHGLKPKFDDPPSNKPDDIYYHRELLCQSVEKRRLDLITISSHHNITPVREPRFQYLFPDFTTPRCFKFDRKRWNLMFPFDKLPLKIRRHFMGPHEKKVIFLSARVHPGETPSSFVMNGIISFLVTKDDPVAAALRKHFVFKIIPMLNPDGVFRGNYRTDTRGVNLNRVYLNPSPFENPSIYGARKLLLYYNFDKEVDDLMMPPTTDDDIIPVNNGKVSNLEDGVSDLKLGQNIIKPPLAENESRDSDKLSVGSDGNKKQLSLFSPTSRGDQPDPGVFLYIDMHGHASKKGIFMYGNHFETVHENVECMLYPKLVSLNSQHFHFDSCNFTERNMYLKDKKDGSSREGAGRVAVLKTLGLIRSYTLECNYNTGKRVNIIPPPAREALDRRPVSNVTTPPKYTPQVYEEVGRSLMWSILDLTGNHPNSRLGNSSHRTLANVRETLKQQVLFDAATAQNINSLPPVNLKGSSRVHKARADTRMRSTSRAAAALHGEHNIYHHPPSSKTRRLGAAAAHNRGPHSMGSTVQAAVANASIVGLGSNNKTIVNKSRPPSRIIDELTVQSSPSSPSGQSNSCGTNNSWRLNVSRLEKRDTRDNCRLLPAEQRRKKLKPK